MKYVEPKAKPKHKKKKKFKIVRKTFKAVLISTACVTLLSSFLNSAKPSENTVINTASTSTYTTSDYRPQMSDEYIVVDNINTPIYMSETARNDFNEYLSSIQTPYVTSEIFGIDEAVSRYSQINNNIQHSHNILDENGQITVERLVESVRKNNTAYLEEIASEASFYEPMSDSDLREICTIIVDHVNNELEKNPNLDINTISCKLGNLKIFNKAMASMASVNQDDVLAVSANMTNVLQLMHDDQDAFKGTIVHETNHLLQDVCIDQELENETIIGGFVEYDDMATDPLMYKWFIEASAEKAMANSLGYHTMTYETQISYLESISLATILDSDVQVNQTEQITFNKDISQLFSQFNSSNFDPEIINMMYAIEIIQTEPEGYFEKYQEVYGEELTEERLVEIKRQLKGSICETLTKNFYKNLANAVAQGNVTEQDVFFLINLFECDVYEHILYDDEAKYNSAEAFMNNYVQIQNQFFTSLANSTGLSYDQLVEDFENYSSHVIYNGEEVNNYSLSFLPEEKRSYVIERYDELYSSNILSIAKTVEANSAQKTY